MSEGSAVAGTAQFAGLRVGLVGPLPPPAGGMANRSMTEATSARPLPYGRAAIASTTRDSVTDGKQ